MRSGCDPLGAAAIAMRTMNRNDDGHRRTVDDDDDTGDARVTTSAIINSTDCHANATPISYPISKRDAYDEQIVDAADAAPTVMTNTILSGNLASMNPTKPAGGTAKRASTRTAAVHARTTIASATARRPWKRRTAPRVSLIPPPPSPTLSPISLPPAVSALPLLIPSRPPLTTHIQQSPKRKVAKNEQRSIVIADPHVPNNGDIEVELDPDFPVPAVAMIDRSRRVVHKVPEGSIKIGFFEKLQGYK